MGTRRVLAGVFILSVLVQLGLLSVKEKVLGDSTTVDYEVYYRPVAESIVAGKGIALWGRPAIFRPPGWSLVIASLLWASNLTGIPGELLISAFNVLSVATMAVLIFLLGAELCGKRTALLASLLWIVYPPTAWLTLLRMSEVPFTLCLFLSIWCFIRAQKLGSLAWMLAAGGILAASAQCRPHYLLPFLAFFSLAYRPMTMGRRLLLVAGLFVGFILTVLPWEVYAYRCSGRVIPLGSEGLVAVYDGTTFALAPGSSGVLRSIPADVVALMKRMEARHLSDPTKEELLAALFEETRSDPMAMAKLAGLKFVRSWYASGSGRHEVELLFLQLVCLTTGVAGMVQAARLSPRLRRGAILVLLLTLYFWVVASMVVPLLRLIIPAMGMVLVFSAFLITRLLWPDRSPESLPWSRWPGRPEPGI